MNKYTYVGSVTTAVVGVSQSACPLLPVQQQILALYLTDVTTDEKNFPKYVCLHTEPRCRSCSCLNVTEHRELSPGFNSRTTSRVFGESSGTMRLSCTCLLAWAGALGLLLSCDNRGWRRVIWRATRSFIMEWRACLSSEEDNGLGERHK